MRLFLVSLFVLWAVPSVAQTTFTVSVATKTSAHPAFGQGHSEGYVLNGQQGQPLTLVRGQTYVFSMQNVSSAHPFYLTTSSSGGGGSAWTEGVTGNFATGNAEVTFTVPESAPDELWYQCGVHAMMGGRITVVSSTSSESGVLGLVLDLASANPVRDAMEVRLSIAQPQAVRLDVFALDGRHLAVLHDGILSAQTEHAFRLDASRLAAGVYVIRAVVASQAVERQIVVAR